MLVNSRRKGDVRSWTTSRWHHIYTNHCCM